MIGLSRYHFDISQKCKCLLITSYQEVNRVGMLFSLSLNAVCLYLWQTLQISFFFFQFVNCLLLCLQGFFVMKSFKFLCDQIYPICIASWLWMKVILNIDVKEEFTMCLPSTYMTNGNSLILGHLLNNASLYKHGSSICIYSKFLFLSILLCFVLFTCLFWSSICIYFKFLFLSILFNSLAYLLIHSLVPHSLITAFKTHSKRWTGRNTNWNQDCREKYQ